MNKIITFEEYLQERFAEDYMGLDDDMPDRFDAWLGDLDGEQYIKFADQYGQKLLEEANKKQ